MLDDDNDITTGSTDTDSAAPVEAPAKKTAARKITRTTAKKTTTKKTAAKRTAKKAAAPSDAPAEAPTPETPAPETLAAETPAAETPAAETPAAETPVKKTAKKAPAKKTSKATATKTAAKKTTTRKTAAKKSTAAGSDAATEQAAPDATAPDQTEADQASADQSGAGATAAGDSAAPETSATAVLFQAPEKPKTTRTRKAAAAKKSAAPTAQPESADQEVPAGDPQGTEASGTQGSEDSEAQQKPKKSKKSGGKGKKEKPDTNSETAEDGPEKPKKGKKSGSGTSKKSSDAGAKDRDAKDGDAKDDTSDAQVADSRSDEADNGSPSGDAHAADSGDGGDQDNESRDGGEGGDGGESGNGPRRRRRRGGRRRRKSGDTGGDNKAGDSDESGDADSDSGDGQSDNGDGSSSGSRRRRRRRRAGDNNNGSSDDPENTVTKVRQGRTGEDQITAVTGSTRLEAKKQRRREGREAGRRRAPIVSEAEFLARRESVDRVMVIRQRQDLTQIAVLEDKVLVEHYVARESQTSLIGNVYVGRVQNVLPSMEAAFVDIGKGRNAVIYAGEVNWAALGHKDGQPRKIESVLTSGQSILVQVTKDPIGHKGARLTGQVSLAGRFLVYVPDGTTSGISRKLPDTERSRLKSLLKEIVPDTAGVIVRTAAEGASEAELTADVERLKARWEDIESKSKSGGPKLLYGEPDLTLKVVRDLFTEDFSKLVIEGDDAWDTVHGYVSHVAPDLADRLERFEAQEGKDSFAAHRIDEQIAKGVDRKVWLPSGGSLIIDRTEAMTVVDVNTGKFTGSGGNLEETVTKNNLEAAEEIVRQLRLRDIGGIIVVDFIDMVLESNRDLVLRRLVECLGRDRTRHQVAEVTSLGLVQMTRKRIGTGLLEAFSETCEHCQGRGVIVHDMPIEPKKSDDDRGRSGGRRGRGRGKGDGGRGDGGRGDGGNASATPSPKDVAAVAKPENADKPPLDEADSASKPDAPKSGAPQPDAPKSGAPEVDAAKSGAQKSDHSSAEPVAKPSEPAPTEPAPTEPTPVEPAPVEPAPVEPAASEVRASGPETTPQVVTRTRRRASRPTGVSAPAPVEPITVAAAPAPDTAPEPAAAPTVVTTTRTRRGATRTSTSAAATTDQANAGQPDATQPDADQPDATQSDATQSDAHQPDAAQPTALHVPVKKKGSRKH